MIGWYIKKDGKHLYVGKKSVKDPKELSILETAIYTRKINRLSLAAKIHIFSAEEPDDDKSAREMRAYFKSRGFDEESAMQYLDAYIAMGKDEEEAVQCVNDSAEQILSDPDK